MRTLFVLLCALSVGCVSATVSEPSVCDTQSISWTLPPLSAPPGSFSVAPATVPQLMTSAPIDFSDAVDKFSKVADSITLSVNHLSIDNSSSDLGWINYMQIYMQGGTSDMPPIFLAGYTGAANSASELDFILQASNDDVSRYFKSGKVILSFVLGDQTGTLVSPQITQMLNGLNGKLSTSANVCVSVSAQINKSI